MSTFFCYFDKTYLNIVMYIAFRIYPSSGVFTGADYADRSTLKPVAYLRISKGGGLN